MAISNSADAFAIQYSMLKITAGWPEDNSSIWYRLRTAFNYFICILLGITMIMEAWHDRSDFGKLSEILYILITVVLYVTKHGNIYYHSEGFKKMIKFLDNPIFSSYDEDLNYLMEKRIRISRFLANSYRYLVCSVVMLMTVMPFIDKQPLPFPFPYELGNYKWLMYIFQIITVSMCAWNNSSLNTLAVSLIGISATHLEILSEKLMRLQNTIDKTKNEIKEELKQCVLYHLAIIEYVKYIDEVFSFGIFAQFFGSVMIICNTMFHFIVIPMQSLQFLVLINYLLDKTSELFMHCWFGNDVILNSQSIVNACYTFKWYNTENEIRQHLIIIMERSKRPLKITALKFSTLSLAAFTSVLQWTYSYFALLMKLYNKPT